MANHFLDAALRYAERGWRVIPVLPRDKSPWFRDWTKLATTDQDAIRNWWASTPNANVGVALGSGSGIVAIDVDSAFGEELLAEHSGGDIPATVEKITPAGRRLIFAIPKDIEHEPRNGLSFSNPDGKSEALRFQARGGQMVCPPSVHPGTPEKGIPPGGVYKWAPGRSPDEIELAVMPDWLIAVMGHVENPTWADPHHHKPIDATAPGSDYNRRGSWEELLTRHGWKPAGGRGEVTYWTRPAKGSGVSASLGHCRTRDGLPALYVFSGSVPDLPANRAYDLFGAYARLEHGGDFKAAAKALAAKGYGSVSRNGKADGHSSTSPTSPGVSPGQSTGQLLVDDLSKIEPKAVRFLVPEIIPAGMLGIFAGEGGTGKSSATLELAAALSVGRCAFGMSYPDPAKGKTLLISCEDDWSNTIVPRLAALGADLRQILRVEGVRMKAGGEVLDFHMGHYRELEALLRSDPAIRLVVIDPAGAYIGKSGVNDHKDSELRSLLGPLSETANQTGATVLLVKHLNKSANVSAVQRVSGSVGFVNACRFSYVFGPDSESSDGASLMCSLKANVLPKPRTALAYSHQSIDPAEARSLLLDQWPNLALEELERLSGQLFRLRWNGRRDADPESIVNVSKRGGTAERGGRIDNVEECMAFIRSFLGTHSWPESELKQAVYGAGFSGSAYKDAKTKLRGLDRNDPTRLSSYPLIAGGQWWCWIGPKSTRCPDRPLCSPNSQDSPNWKDSQDSPNQSSEFSQSCESVSVVSVNQTGQPTLWTDPPDLSALQS